MNVAQKIQGMYNIDKKMYVLKKARDVLGNEAYNRYEPVLSLIIDLLKMLSKNNKVLDSLKSTKRFLSCVK
jgi:hypothetical protein